MLGWFWNILFKKKAMTTFNKGDIIIDISKHNSVAKKIDWNKVKADPQNIKGVIIKATEGATAKDRFVFEHVAGARSVGLPISYYHFATWNREDEEQDALEEAQFFLSIVKGAGLPDFDLFLDVESNKPIPYTKEEMVAYVKEFTRVVLKEFGIGIYASPGFLNQYFPSNHPFAMLNWWAADYTGQINPVPGWGQKAWLRQIKDTGKVNGINGPVDINIVQ